MFELTDEEKEEMHAALRTILGGTPVQDDRDFILGVILPTVVGWVERRDEVFKREGHDDRP